MRHNKRQKRVAQEAMQPADTRLQITEEEIPLHIQIHKVAMHMGLSPSDLAVYMALKYHADGTVQEDDVFPSHERLGKLANVSDRTVFRSMATLVSKGMVKKTSTKKKGRYMVNHYLLLSPFRWADPELLKELSYKKPCATVAPDQMPQWRENKNQAFKKNQIQEPAATNLGSTVVTEAESPDTPPPESNSLLAAFLESEQFNPDQNQIVETFLQTNDLSEDQVYTVLFNLAQEGVHKDGLLYAMKQVFLFRPDSVIPYLYSVARANPSGGPLNEPGRFYTEGRRDNSQSGQHVPTRELPDVNEVYEQIKDKPKDKPWDHYDFTGGVRFLTLEAFDLKDTESNKIWFDGIWRELKNMRQKELTNEYSLREEVTSEVKG